MQTNNTGLPDFQPLSDNCTGCERVVLTEDRCSAFISPAAKWRNGNCNLATHVKEEAVSHGKKRVGQQKQKKNRR